MKFLKIIGIIVAALAVLIIVATVVARIIFTKEKILSIVIPKIEEAIHRQVSVKDASISIFPSISLNVDSLVIKNKSGFQQENLISLAKFSVRLKLLPLLSKKIELKKLVLVKPDIYLEKSAEQNSNYQDFLQTEKEEKIVPITFDRLEIKEGRIVYYNRPKQSSIVIEGLNQEGELKKVEDHILTSRGKLSIGDIQLKRTEEVLSYPLELDYQASYDLIFDSLHVSQARIKFAGIEIEAKGKVEDLTRQATLNLELKTENMSVAELQALLPEAQRIKFKEWKTTGTLSLNAKGYWDFKQGLRPSQLDGQVLIKEVQLTPAQGQASLSVPLMTAKLSSTSVVVTTSQAKFGEAPLQFKAILENFDQPTVTGELSSTVDLSLLLKFLSTAPGTEIRGSLDLKTNFFGKVKELKNFNLAGVATLTNVGVASPQLAQPIQNLNGRFKLGQGELTVENLSARQGRSSFNLGGNCKKLVGYFLAKEGEKASMKPMFKFNFSSSYLNLDENLPAGSEEAKTSQEDTVPANAAFLGLANFMDFDGSLKVDTAIFRQIEMTDFKGNLYIVDGVVQLTEVSGKVYSGTASGEVTCDLSDPNDVKFDLKVESQGMDANQFLSRFSRIQDHLFGNLNFQGTFSGSGNSVPQIQNSLTGNGKVSFTEGKLSGWEFYNKMAGFLSLEEMKEENIKELNHLFEVKDGRLFFKNFLASSSKADWQVAGSIGLLDQSLDYSLNILLAPEISNQVTILGDQASFLKDEKGRLLVPLKIGGTGSSPKFSIDMSLISQKLQSQLKQNLEEKKTDLREDLQKKGKDLLEELLKKKKKDG